LIAEYLPHVESAEAVPQSFAEGEKALDKPSADERLYEAGLQKLIDTYLFTERLPLNDDIVGLLIEKPKLLQRKTITERIKDKVLDFVEAFFTDIPEVD
jgi:type I restriction enzyme, R subunit